MYCHNQLQEGQCPPMCLIINSLSYEVGVRVGLGIKVGLGVVAIAIMIKLLLI